MPLKIQKENYFQLIGCGHKITKCELLTIQTIIFTIHPSIHPSQWSLQKIHFCTDQQTNQWI